MILINDRHRYDASLGLILFVLVWDDVLGIMMVLMLLLSQIRRTVVHPTWDFITETLSKWASSCANVCECVTSLGGDDFEIIPMNNILPAHHLWARSLKLHFLPRAGWFFHGRQVRPEKSEATRPISWYQPRTGYTPLRSWYWSLWARRWRIVAIIGLHCLSEIGTLSQNRYWFW